jgi:hypothetical protein
LARTKVQAIKEKKIKWISSKFKMCTSRGTIKTAKRQPIKWIRYLQITGDKQLIAIIIHKEFL